MKLKIKKTTIIMKKIFIFLILFTVFTTNAKAQLRYPSIKADYVYIVDVGSDDVLYEKNADAKMYPASLSKLMVLYVVFQKLSNNSLSLDDIVNVSDNAFTKGHFTTGGSTMFLKKGERVSVEMLLKGIIVSSGNDATIALAEHIYGSEENFISEMNSVAQGLGMTNTAFINTDGVHNEGHYSTAKDLVILSRAIINDFPQYYSLFSIKQFRHNGVNQNNRNQLINIDTKSPIIIDGLKTGHTLVSLYSLAFSSIKKENGFRIVGVLSGATSEYNRTSETRKLIDWIYENYNQEIIYKKGDLITEIPLINSKGITIKVFAPYDITYILERATRGINVKLIRKSYIHGSVNKDDIVATLKITAADSKFNTTYYLKPEITVERTNLLQSVVLAPYNAFRHWYYTRE